MSIRFDEKRKIFYLETVNSTYAFQVYENEFLIHLYYGKKNQEIEDYKSRLVSFSPYYERYRDYLPNVCLSEYAGFDDGDFRTTSIRMKNKDGNSVTVLTYKGYQIIKGRVALPGLPYGEADNETETLEIQMCDGYTGLNVLLYYTVFPKEDIISRYVRVLNGGTDVLQIEKCMSLLLDLPNNQYDMISLYGCHNFERSVQRCALSYGMQSISSRRGASSPQFNPFFALCEKGASELQGDVYGFNFVYSGNFLSEVEVDHLNQTRIQVGLGCDNFTWRLEPGETFNTPEAVMTYSSKGIGQMSRNFHRFTRNHLLPKEPFAQRPVVLNTWEACYFDIDESVMYEFAKSAAETGIDMLVMDDGWFGKRNNDKSGLGDWFVNRDKFKDGLKPFVDRIKSYGLKFGIWVEPEMVNPDSELYRTHPTWCIECPGREKMLGRSQWVLDMTNPEVITYLKDIFSETFDGLGVDYFKWDMNRHMSQVGSPYLPIERQGETAYRYMLGVYELLEWFHNRYPNAMIETCSGGGGRYDLGMMKYGTMIWTSDNTWPHDRIRIQYGSLLAYPATTMSCHVSQHEKCEDKEQHKYRYEVALGGALGYEMHLPNSSQQLKDRVKQQIIDYRKYEDLILKGDYYSLLNPFETNYSAYYYIDDSKKHILLAFLQILAEEPSKQVLKIVDLEQDAIYKDECSGLKYTGAELGRGVEIESRNHDQHSNIWYFVKQ